MQLFCSIFTSWRTRRYEEIILYHQKNCEAFNRYSYHSLQPTSHTFLQPTTHLSYSLAKVSHSFTNSSSIIHSPTEAILFQYMHQLTKEDASFPNFRKIETWLILSPLPFIAFLSVGIIVLHRRIQILHAVISASALMQRTHAIELKTIAPTQPVSTTQIPIMLWLEQIRQHDIILITLIICIIVILIALIWAVRKALKRESWLYLDISSANRVMQLKFFQLPDSTRCFEINLPKTETQLTFRSYFLFGIIAFTTPAWRITHSLTKMQIELPRILCIPPWKIAVIQKIFRENEFKAVPLVVHSHEYSFVRNATNLAVVEDKVRKEILTVNSSCKTRENISKGQFESREVNNRMYIINCM
jgi:hypothetical protein